MHRLYSTARSASRELVTYGLYEVISAPAADAETVQLTTSNRPILTQVACITLDRLRKVGLEINANAKTVQLVA